MATAKNKRKDFAKKVISFLIILAILWYIGNAAVQQGGETQNGSENVTSTTTTTQGFTSADGTLTLSMIEVGQADSFLLVQDDNVALIDCGTRSTGENVINYLNSQGITEIDYLFGTHPHDDHMGGMYDVISNFKIGKIILPKVKNGEVTSNWYMKLMQKIKKDKYNLEYAKVGTVYNLGDAKMKVIGPISAPEDNLNNYSTVLKVSFGQMDVIMAGDAEKDVEKEIIKSGENLDAEILKIGHHGSDTSSCIEWLDAISPKYALISAETGNRYNHPIKETMQNLKKRKIEVYRTDECGTVTLTITSNDVKFSCKPGNYLSGTELAERSGKP